MVRNTDENKKKYEGIEKKDRKKWRKGRIGNQKMKMKTQRRMIQMMKRYDNKCRNYLLLLCNMYCFGSFYASGCQKQQNYNFRYLKRYANIMKKCHNCKWTDWCRFLYQSRKMRKIQDRNRIMRKERSRDSLIDNQAKQTNKCERKKNGAILAWSWLVVATKLFIKLFFFT